MIRTPAALLFFALFLGLPSARAQLGEDLTQGYTLRAQPLSFGGAYRALADSNAAILMNPAGIAQRKGEVSGSGDYIYNGPTNSHAFSVSIVDYKTSEELALGLEYDYDAPNFSVGDASAHQFTLSMAREIFPFLLMGVSGKYFSSNVEGTLANGPDGFDVDVGMLLKPIPLFSLAVSAQNLAQGTSHAEFPLTLGFGGALFLPPHARIAADVVRDFGTDHPDSLNAYFGAELRAAEGIFLRGGFGLDQVRDNNFYSLGMAALGPKANILFTFSQHLNPTDETYAVGLEFYF